MKMIPNINLIGAGRLKAGVHAPMGGVFRVLTGPEGLVQRLEAMPSHLAQVEHELRAGVHVKCADRFAAEEHGGGQRNLKMEPKYENIG